MHINPRCIGWKQVTHSLTQHYTVKSNIYEVPLKTPDADKDADFEFKMEYDAILHYLKSAANFNNSTDTNKENTENISPTLQVNNPIINRPIHLISSGNLARSTSFKSFENI